MPPQRMKATKCNYYNPMTGDPDPVPCPRSSKVCWFIHPNEAEWSSRAKVMSSPPKRLVGGGLKKSLSSRIGRGRSRGRSRSRSRSRSRGSERGRSRSQSRGGGKYVSPNWRRPRHSSPPPPPPRRPLHERIQRSNSPRPRSPPRSRLRSRSPSRRRPINRRPRTRTSTPISSSRAHSPSDDKLGNFPQGVKPEPSTDAVPTPVSVPLHPIQCDMSITTADDQTPTLPRGSVDQQSHQQPSLNLSPGELPTATSDSAQPPSPLVDPLSPIFAPETPIIPGLSAAASFTQQNTTEMSSLQKSLDQVIQAMNPSTVPPDGKVSDSHPTTVPKEEKTKIWTTRMRLWADLMKAKSEVREWQDEVNVAQSWRNRAGFESFSKEARDQIQARITFATTNLVQHQLAFEAIVSQSIALDRDVSKTNAALAPPPPAPSPRETSHREMELMQERIQFATLRMDDLERKLALQDQLVERVKAEQEAVAALPQLPSSASSWSPVAVNDGDGVLDHMPSLKRKRTDDDDSRPSSRRRSLARTIADLQESNDTLTDRIAEAEGTIEGILNDVVEDPEGEESSRATRLKEIFQDYQSFIENAKTAVEATERNSRVVEALKTEAERAIADWNEVYQEFQTVRNEAMEIHKREKERAKEIKDKEERIVTMQREIETLNVTIQAFVDQQSAQPEVPLTLEQVIEVLKPCLLEEMREATRPLLDRKHTELQRMLDNHIAAIRVSVYEPIRMSEQVARTMVNWLEAEFAFGETKKR